MPEDQMQSAPQEEVAKLFQNVGKGLLLIQQYVAQVAPQSSQEIEAIIKVYEEIIQRIVAARQQPRQSRPQMFQAQGQPAPQEAGAARVQQAM